MGDRSNVNIITEKIEDTDKYLMLNIYSHWGGKAVQRDALDKAVEVLDRAAYDGSYFSRAIVRTVTDGDDGATGSGVSPRLVEGIEEAYKQTEDNEYDILNFDLVNKKLVLFRHYGGYAGIPEVAEVIAEAPLTAEGIAEMKAVI